MIKLTKVRPHSRRDTRVIALLKRTVVLLPVFQGALSPSTTEQGCQPRITLPLKLYPVRR